VQFLAIVATACLLGPTPAPESTVVHPTLWQALDQQQNRAKVWVFFTDKGLGGAIERTAAVAEARSRLQGRAIERRRLRRTAPGLIDDRDLDVCGRFVHAVAATGAEISVTSRWLNAVSAHVSAGQVCELADLPFVRRIEPVRRGHASEAIPIVSPEPAWHGGVAAGGFYGLAQDQLDQIGVTDMHTAGFTGSGILIGVLDTGFVRTHEAYNEPGHVIDIVAEWDFVNDDGNTAIEAGDPGSQHSHGTLVLSTIGGYRPGTFVGGAYDASFVLAKTEDVADEYEMEEDFYAAGLEMIEAQGADLATSSLGYIQWYTWFDLDGLTAVTSIAVNTATDNGLVCCTAAGNGGFNAELPPLLAPSDAFDVITCGAVDDLGLIAGFSSNGPTADGRVKPEVLARGVSTACVNPNDDTAYQTASGTSLATPLVASAVALLIQAHPEWTIAQIRTALILTADYFVANGTHDPEFRLGYGVINVFAASQADLCPADLDDDGSVGINDFLALLAAWGPNPGHPADFDGDGSVGITDFLALLETWGACP